MRQFCQDASAARLFSFEHATEMDSRQFRGQTFSTRKLIEKRTSEKISRVAAPQHINGYG
jgi:hypothetical protein